MEHLQRHEIDGVALGFGLAFTLVAVLGLTGRLDDGDVAWLVPGLLAVVAVSVATSALLRRRTAIAASARAGVPAVADQPAPPRAFAAEPSEPTEPPEPARPDEPPAPSEPIASSKPDEPPAAGEPGESDRCP